MSGSNLPPGCNVSDIPGNSLEDIQYEEELEEAMNYLEKIKPRPGEMMLAVKIGVTAIVQARKYADILLLDERAENQQSADAGQCPFCKQKR